MSIGNPSAGALSPEVATTTTGAGESVTAETARSGFIGHLHAFRGFAILTIVAAHAWSMLLFQNGFDTMASHTAVYSVVETLFHGSTIYFALISGLLFSLILRGRGWKTFFRSKALHVVAPYAFINLLFIAAFWPMIADWLASEGRLTNPAVFYLKSLVLGDLMLQYWYIPVLIVLYVATPVFDLLIRRAAGVAWLVALVPLVISRSLYPDLLSVQTMIYFAGAYTLGMLAGTHYQAAQRLIREYLRVFWVAAVGCSLVIFLKYLNEPETTGVFLITESLFYVQKVAISGLILHYMAKHESSLPGWLLMFGTYAFAIYFLHLFFAQMGVGAIGLVSEGYTNAWTASLGGLLILASALGASLLFAWLFKKLFRKYSRMLVGV